MTNEEKAEEYKRHYPISELCVKLSQMNNVMDEGYHFLLNKIEQTYLDGLAEGRKETYEKLLEEVRTYTGIKQLTSEQLTIEQLTKFSMEGQCKYCKEHCGEVYHFNLAKNNFELEKENAKLSKMLEMAINDTIRKGNQCFYCKDNYTKDICDNCTEENRINVMKLYRAELEKRVENEK